LEIIASTVPGEEAMYLIGSSLVCETSPRSCSPARALRMAPADSPVADLICAQVADRVVATKQ
jgi:hypothetical protein